MLTLYPIRSSSIWYLPLEIKKRLDNIAASPIVQDLVQHAHFVPNPLILDVVLAARKTTKGGQ
jgi:hypothetical protein